MPITNQSVAIAIAKSHIESAFSDYMVFAFDEKSGQLCEFGSVPSEAVLQKMYELFLAKIEQKKHYNDPNV